MDITDVITMIEHETKEYAKRNTKVILDSQYKTTRLTQEQLQGKIGAVNAAREIRVNLLNAIGAAG
jgi:hypothetical protein